MKKTFRILFCSVFLTFALAAQETAGLFRMIPSDTVFALGVDCAKLRSHPLFHKYFAEGALIKDLEKKIDNKSANTLKNLQYLLIVSSDALFRSANVLIRIPDAEAIQAELAGDKEVLPVRTEKLSNAVGVKCGRLTVRSQISRWGSCSANRNISLNCLLVLCPPEVTDYVIIHELCHIRHMNHSRAFWRDVERFCPGYRSRREWLRKEGVFLIERLKKSRAQSSESTSETGA